ncbi:MAG TPA: hypothetical protein VKB79_25075 [Bryobacteraceae bacterium]|nr:hypothetical protein [Bryobacteraceae bacterium]
MNEKDEALRELLRRAAPCPADRKLKRDLWPEMRRCLERPPVPIPWGDWAIAATLLVCLLLFPKAIPAVLYLL